MNILALYLPQFHQIKENNEWWGNGFTEWENVKKAKPLFNGHNQPRVPLNSNYYNLLDKKTMMWQISLAKKYGIYGFCVYHYWFHGHLLLEKPMEIFLENKELDFPICFCWANEHWTNAWVSGENKILIEQKFDDPQDWVSHFKYLLPFFKDKRYIKEDNKPLFVIYFPSIMRDVLKSFINCWNELAQKYGFNGIKFIFQHQIFYNENTNLKSLFDYGIQFEPSLAMMKLNDKKNFISEKFKTKLSIFLQTKFHIYRIKKDPKTCRKIDYQTLWNTVLEMKPSKGTFITIPGFFVDWDNTPRRGKNGSCLVGTSVESFEYNFSKFVANFKLNYKTKWSIVFSWNEWAEGGYLEPDEKNDFGYLESINKVLKKYGELPSND
jgi:hypothetical protein